MANHVNTTVTFAKINDAAKAKLEEIFKRIRPSDKERHYNWFGDIFVDGKEGSPTYEESEKYEWTTTNIGPKWCYVEDFGDDYFHLVSAWSVPYEGINWLLQELETVDENLVAEVVYEDEMPNFFGAYIWANGGVFDELEYDSEETERLMEENFPELAELRDEDGEFTEEGYELWSDNIWEIVSNTQHQWTMETLQVVEDNEN